MKWYIKNHMGFFWMGPTNGWGTLMEKASRFDNPNEAMQNLLSCRYKSNGEPIIFTCGIEVRQVTN